MAITAKPTVYTVNTGHAKCPDHLYMLDDSTGATNCNDGVGTLDLTIDSTAMWNTDATYGSVLRFVSASSQKALSGNTFAATSGICLVAIEKTASTTNPTLDQRVISVGHNSTSGVYGGMKFTLTDGYLRGDADSGGAYNTKSYGADYYDATWRVIAVKMNDSTGSDGVISLSVDGGAWVSNAGTGDQDVSQFVRIGLGCRASPTPNEFFDGDILAAYVYVNDYSAWDDTWIASIYSDPWQFLNTAQAFQYQPRLNQLLRM